jgi:uncharacterized membrane protein
MVDPGSTAIDDADGTPLDEPHHGSTETTREDERPKKRHRRIPIWVKVSVIIALVLIGVVVSSMALGASGIDGHGGDGGGDHGTPSADETPLLDDGPSGDSSDHTSSDGSGDHTSSEGSSDHGSGDHG